MPKFTFKEWDAALRLGLRNKVQVEIRRSSIFWPEKIYVVKNSGVDHLFLPGDRDGAGAELQVKGVILCIQANTFDGWKLEMKLKTKLYKKIQLNKNIETIRVLDIDGFWIEALDWTFLLHF